MTTKITTAMVLAAGLGTRMRPITDTTPKPLVRVGGKSLMDWTLDDFAAGGIERAVVNVHHLADQVRAHVAQRHLPRMTVSDETELLLETGGGIVKALPLLGDDPFLVANTDAFTLQSSLNPVARLAAAWGDDVDGVLLLHPLSQTLGFDGAGDFFIDSLGYLTPRGAASSAPYVYAGIQLLHPRALKSEKVEPFSVWRIWRRLIDTKRMRGVVQDGRWFHVGTPEAIPATDAALARLHSVRP